MYFLGWSLAITVWCMFMQIEPHVAYFSGNTMVTFGVFICKTDNVINKKGMVDVYCPGYHAKHIFKD